MNSIAINLGQPVNWSHPLNRGRVAWWKALPGRMGGPTWRDLCGKYHGTLTNVSTGPTSGFGATRQLSNFGELRLDGSDDKVDCGANVPTGGTAISVGVTLRLGSTSAGRIVGRWGGTSAEQSFLMYLGAAGVIGFAVFDGSFGYNARESISLGAGAYYRLLVTFACPSTMFIYVNGASQSLSSTASATMAAIANGSGSVAIGYEATTPFAPILGAVDDVTIYSRALLPSEVYQDFILSRQGYPGVLNRMQMFPTGGSSAASANKGPFESHIFAGSVFG